MEALVVVVVGRAVLGAAALGEMHLAEAIDKTAAAIAAVLQTDPAAVFDVEGHTSADGAEDFNLNLSAARAKRIFDELTLRYRIPASALSAHGYGESYPMFPNGHEGELMLDRRVLVVRVK